MESSLLEAMTQSATHSAPQVHPSTSEDRWQTAATVLLAMNKGDGWSPLEARGATMHLFRSHSALSGDTVWLPRPFLVTSVALA